MFLIWAYGYKVDVVENMGELNWSRNFQKTPNALSWQPWSFSVSALMTYSPHEFWLSKNTHLYRQKCIKLLLIFFAFLLIFVDENHSCQSTRRFFSSLFFPPILSRITATTPSPSFALMFYTIHLQHTVTENDYQYLLESINTIIIIHHHQIKIPPHHPNYWLTGWWA